MKNNDSQKDNTTSGTLQQVELEKVNDDPANIEGTNDEEVLTQELLQQHDSIAYRRPRREIRMPARFDDRWPMHFQLQMMISWHECALNVPRAKRNIYKSFEIEMAKVEVFKMFLGFGSEEDGEERSSFEVSSSCDLSLEKSEILIDVEVFCDVYAVKGRL
ncbi:hypothetical protein GOBAR_DD13249 [Gossypium barbadense]|nr:hypothetical protein GOBAR_DD13249 [Gossypium barbadense]